MIHEVIGIIDFEPEPVTKKHIGQSVWKHVAMIRTDCDMHMFYGWLLKKRFNLELNKPLRGCHVTFISDKFEKTVFEEAKQMFNGKSIKFFIDTAPKSNGEHWWLRVYSPDAENIREAIGLTREPYFGLHLTIGHANEKNIEHSEYILRMCKMFNLIEYEPRLTQEEQKNLNNY